MARVLILAALIGGTAADPTGAPPAPQSAAPTPDETGGEAPPPATSTPAPAATAPATPAEQIARLTGSIAEDTRRLDGLREDLDAARAEVDRANAEFRQVDQRHREQAEALDRLRQAERPTEDLEAALEALETTRTLVGERRELAAAALKTLTEQIATLEIKLRQSDHALRRLLGEAPDEPAPAQSPPATPTPAPVASAPASPPAAEALEAEDPGLAALPGLGTLPGIGAGPSGPPTFGPEPDDPKLAKAREAARTIADALKQAEDEVADLADRLRTIDEQFRNEEQARDTARRKIDNAEATGAELAREYQDRLFGGAPAGVLRELQEKIRENDRRLIQARGESREHSDEIIRLQTERGELASQLQLARWRVESARLQLTEAESTLRRLENPFTPENLINWLLRHGLNIVAIVVGMMLLRWGSHLVSRRIVALLSQRGLRGTTAEKEHRVTTLVGVFDNAASVAIVVGGILMIFQEVGVPVGPLLGGAAVLGLAVAFGAQNLIRDYFYGFVILLENQYKLNDVIRIRSIAGQVEAITLRVTVLRDLEGCVHFIPNGEITSVTNMTHGWSRALFDIRVAYKEDVDHVMNVIVEVGKELRTDPMFRMLILEDPTMLGVDALDESAVIIKFFIKTRPLQQWTVKRELLRRLKKKFDELGISIPFPHRTIYHAHGEAHLEGVPDPHLLGNEVFVAGRAAPGTVRGR